ncbi:cysteine-rich CWC family protein [Paenibacillus sp. L3-i20]|uniref:cysteine-rich CWC family protein n=1 Tax=Paenibacillus sp. L3-i20 TaxID=2905833 RepID=UPI0024A6324A|nr:cysteine-rich CWC family protein [Paenibacillus sp. L3-i20]
MSDRCPLCGENNKCEMEQSAPLSDCWCFHTTIPKELLALIPETSLGKACICNNCVKNFRNSASKNDSLKIPHAP